MPSCFYLLNVIFFFHQRLSSNIRVRLCIYSCIPLIWNFICSLSCPHSGPMRFFSVVGAFTSFLISHHFGFLIVPLKVMARNLFSLSVYNENHSSSKSSPSYSPSIFLPIHLPKLSVNLFTNPSAQAVYDTRSIFKWSLTGLNSEFSFS